MAESSLSPAFLPPIIRAGSGPVKAAEIRVVFQFEILVEFFVTRFLARHGSEVRMGWIDLLGYAGAVATLFAFWSKTMIPLRIAAIGANIFFIVYGVMGQFWPVLVLHLILLPLNAHRLIGMQRLVRRVKEAVRSNLNADWFQPYMKRVSFEAGELIFRRGEEADRAYYVVSGEVIFPETGRKATMGKLIGDVGIFTPDKRRTLSCKCETDVEVFFITYDEILQLYFQNPQFGFYLVQLIVSSMKDHIETFEKRLENSGHNISN